MKRSPRYEPRPHGAARAVALCCALVLVSLPVETEAARIKDIAHVQGARANQLIGYGIVVGLDNTGDTIQSALTAQTIASMLGRMNIKIERQDLRTRNVAAVMVTAELPQFARSGQTEDVIVSSLGDARSLKGGTLLMAPLRGVDGEVYAIAQGALTTGGFEVQGAGANSRQRNHLNVGRIPAGAMIEQSVGEELGAKSGGEELRINLFQADFTTATKAAEAISQAFAAPGAPAPDPSQPSEGIASALDAATVRIEVPEAWRDHLPEFIAKIEQLDVTPDAVARVIVNERTGTVVLGGQVRIREVAVAHGNLTLNVSTSYAASQPAPFLGRGDTAVLPESEVGVEEEPAALQVLKEGATIAEVVGALNAIGVSPRDLIAILQAIHAAGALDAEIEVQ